MTTTVRWTESIDDETEIAVAEEARALADFEASEPTPDPRSLVPILAGALAPPPILPPGRTRTAERPKSGNSASIDV